MAANIHRAEAQTTATAPVVVVDLNRAIANLIAGRWNTATPAQLAAVNAR
jgi:hypothetical protein